MVTIVDYKAGNIRSVERAFQKLGIPCQVVDSPDAVLKAERILFPGVGHAVSAMDYLNQSGLAESLRQVVQAGRPFLGICLGSQIILEHTEEGPVSTLGILNGRTRYFGALLGPLSRQTGAHDTGSCGSVALSRLGGFTIDGQRLKVPHMGWNKAIPAKSNPAALLFAGVDPQASFYFVHSFYTEAASEEQVLCRTNYGASFASGLARDNVASLQFHPEKSGESGLRILANFAAWRP